MEYGLIVALIAGMLIAVLSAIGTRSSAMFSLLAGKLT